MQVTDFSKQNSVMNHYMAELRDKKYQQNRLLFRNNIKRIGQLMAYELSKTLTYKPKGHPRYSSDQAGGYRAGYRAACRTAFPRGFSGDVRQRR